MIDTAAAKTSEHYRERINHLGDVIDGASGERDLAMYRAHQRGATLEQIARWALTDVDEVRRIVESLSHEPDIDEWGDGPRYIEVYRHTY
jgi:hypothetical protein